MLLFHPGIGDLVVCGDLGVDLIHVLTVGEDIDLDLRLGAGGADDDDVVRLGLCIAFGR